MGVKKEILQDGNRKDFPKAGDTVSMHYIGTLDNELMDKVDSSHDRGKPFVTVIGCGNVIKGWDEVVPTMSLGEKAVITISSDYGYGANAAGARAAQWVPQPDPAARNTHLVSSAFSFFSFFSFFEFLLPGAVYSRLVEIELLKINDKSV